MQFGVPASSRQYISGVWLSHCKSGQPRVFHVRFYHLCALVCGIISSVCTYMCRFTGNWTSCCNVMPLNSPSAKVFWRTLHSHEVQAKTFGFGLLATDSKSNMFSKFLKKKLIDMVNMSHDVTCKYKSFLCFKSI